MKISETMRPESGFFSEAHGLWTGSEIIIKRSELISIERYAATLLHEIGHARSGKTDITIGFEQELTSLLGILASKALHGTASGTKSTQNVAQPPAFLKKSGFWENLFKPFKNTK